jgi:polysaccharide deacetylase family protein (PEP-CTERM system associated)
MFIMSVDLESWVHRPIFDIPVDRQTQSADGGFIPAAADRLLETFAKHGAKATFFSLGSVAEWYPDVMRDIIAEGHELAVHGYTHTPIHRHTRDSFADEIKKTLDVLTAFTNRPIGFRASNCTHAPFLFEVLEENHFEYDSSVFPIRTPLYDWSMYPDSAPFWVTPKILEIPLSIYRIARIRIPVGGFYLRLLGGRVDVELLRRIQERVGVGTFYIHPWEILPNQRVPARRPKRILAGYGIPAVKAFEQVVRSYRWRTFGDSVSAISRGLREGKEGG